MAHHLIHFMNPCQPHIIIAALLHDTLEDTEATGADIMNAFGKEVLQLILEVTDDMTLPSERRKQLQVARAGNLSPEAQALKLADKTCNIRDLLTTRIAWIRERKIQYVRWAKKVVGQFRNSEPVLLEEFNCTVSRASVQLNFVV